MSAARSSERSLAPRDPLPLLARPAAAPPGPRPAPRMMAPSTWTPEELKITRTLVSWRKRFVVTTERKVDTKSEAGYMVVKNYLRCLDAAFQVFQVEPASRHYRRSFTPKYQSKWPGLSRLLRVDVLEASNQQMILMNGFWFELGPTAVDLAGLMRHAWAELGRLLKRLIVEQLAARPWSMELKAEMRCALKELDAAWAKFECAYVMQAMAIEQEARVLVAEACVCERVLSKASQRRGRRGGTAACQKQLGELVRAINLLSSTVCDESRMRAADLSLVTRSLSEAKSILESARLQNHHQRPTPAHALATWATGAFEAVRDYLRIAWHNLESLDGELANNPGLVANFDRFQESMSATARYLADPRLLRGLNCAAAFVRAACATAPGLAILGADCDADFFVALPRIVWLGFLSAPDQTSPLIEHMLPGLFTAPQVRGPDLQALLEAYGQTVERLATAAGKGLPGPEGGDSEGHRRALDMLVQRAAVGIGQEGSSAEAEGFLRRLEGWSMRLQRQQPEVWNELAAILLQHLLGHAP
ncbi:unnamed protein product [Prorocentrum cordatum]|uniref:Uncharacterized protein n=1 Tax=Prorocentrum cordatum TaxID=2364126 RepID=A0ABN9UYU3_9DINO|nr:unnamed protein product [Polarella glacialis]